MPPHCNRGVPSIEAHIIESELPHSGTLLKGSGSRFRRNAFFRSTALTTLPGRMLPARESHLGVTARDNRLFVEAGLYRYRAGISWRDLPERFGDPIKIHARFSGWAETGVWERVLQHLAADVDIEYVIIRQHHRACPSAQRRRTKGGRSRCGLCAQIHAQVDALGNHVSFLLSGILSASFSASRKCMPTR